MNENIIHSFHSNPSGKLSFQFNGFNIVLTIVSCQHACYLFGYDLHLGKELEPKEKPKSLIIFIILNALSFLSDFLADFRFELILKKESEIQIDFFYKYLIVLLLKKSFRAIFFSKSLASGINSSAL